MIRNARDSNFLCVLYTDVQVLFPAHIQSMFIISLIVRSVPAFGIVEALYKHPCHTTGLTNLLSPDKIQSYAIGEELDYGSIFSEDLGDAVPLKGKCLCLVCK